MSNIQGIINKLSIKEGVSKYGTWKKLSALMDDGLWYSIFLDKTGFASDWAEGQAVSFSFVQDGKFNNIINPANPPKNKSVPIDLDQINNKLDRIISLLEPKATPMLVNVSNEEEDLPF